MNSKDSEHRKMDITPSEEQINILNKLENHNVIVDSVAGSGKTSTVLFISERYKDLDILVLTYNSQLKTETRKRAAGCDNLEVHSYHSFCVSNYDKNAYTDDKVNIVVQGDVAPNSIISYDIIIADETQDLTPLLYHFFCKVLKDNKKRKTCKIMIMGDQLQSIYKFREADPRFITMSDKIFNGFNDLPWINCKLSESFRCNVPTVEFINNCMIGYDRLISTKPYHIKPDYVICNSYNYPSEVIDTYLKKYKPQEIFVLGFSIKDKTPIKQLANYVTNNLNIPIYCSTSDQESLDSRVIENKLVFSTIHQAKGRERKAVLLLGFDSSYFEFYDKNADMNICPNEFYVAVTRASEHVTIIHDSKKSYLPFLKSNKLKEYTNFSIFASKCTVKLKMAREENGNMYTVTELVGYLPFSVENTCSKYITTKVLNDSGDKLNVQNIVKMDGAKGSIHGSVYESVSDITGIAIPANFEYKKLGKSTLFSKNIVERNISILEEGAKNGTTKSKLAMITKLKKFSKTLKDFHEKYIENMDIKNLSVSDLLKVSLYYSSQQNKTDYKLKQITNFNWLTNDILTEGTTRLMNVVKGKNLLFEESLELTVHGVTIMAEVDCIDLDNKIVYEFKCTNDLSAVNNIQTALYMYMHKKITKQENYRYILFNIFTNELKEITSNMENLEKILNVLLEHKISDRAEKTDDEFLEDFGNMVVSTIV